jgi:SSS family solute:Na+ symporter
LSEAFPQQLAGLLAALAGMILGSLLPQLLEDHKGHVHHFKGSTAA